MLFLLSSSSLHQYDDFSAGVVFIYCVWLVSFSKLLQNDKQCYGVIIAGWKSRCAEYFPCSTHFEGKHSSVMPDSVYNSSRKSNENGDTPNHLVGQTELSDGQLEAFKSLSVST